MIKLKAGLNLPHGKLMETIDEEGYTFLGILEHDKVKEKEMKTNLLQKIRLILISKLNGKNTVFTQKSAYARKSASPELAPPF